MVGESGERLLIKVACVPTWLKAQSPMPRRPIWGMVESRLVGVDYVAEGGFEGIGVHARSVVVDSDGFLFQGEGDSALLVWGTSGSGHGPLVKGVADVLLYGIGSAAVHGAKGDEGIGLVDFDAYYLFQRRPPFETDNEMNP